jgi:hypothetical protein
MSFALVFWILMLLWLVWSLPFNTWSANAPYASNIMLFILFGLLGWRVFGPALHP